MSLSKRTPLFLTALVLAAATGCGQKELPKRTLYPTRGTLTMNGEPVRFVSVRFIPEDPTQGTNADGNTDGNGAFELRTYSNGEPDGAAAGSYKVVIGDYSGPAVPKGENSTLVPEGAKKLDSTVDVTAGDNDLQIDLPAEK